MIKSYAQEKNVALYTFIGGLHEKFEINEDEQSSRDVQCQHY